MLAKRVQRNNKRTESSIEIEPFNEAGSAPETSPVGDFNAASLQSLGASSCGLKTGQKSAGNGLRAAQQHDEQDQERCQQTSAASTSGPRLVKILGVEASRSSSKIQAHSSFLRGRRVINMLCHGPIDLLRREKLNRFHPGRPSSGDGQ